MGERWHHSPSRGSGSSRKRRSSFSRVSRCRVRGLVHGGPGDETAAAAPGVIHADTSKRKAAELLARHPHDRGWHIEVGRMDHRRPRPRARGHDTRLVTASHSASTSGSYVRWPAVVDRGPDHAGGGSMESSPSRSPSRAAATRMPTCRSRSCSPLRALAPRTRDSTARSRCVAARLARRPRADDAGR